MPNYNIDSEEAFGRFDRYLNIIEGNQAAYHLLGSYVYDSLYHMIAKSDIESVQAAVDSCLLYKTAIGVSANLDINGSRRNFMLNLKPTKGELIQISLIPLEEDDCELAKTRHSLRVSRDYLSLAGGFLMQYTPISDVFSLFWLNNDEHIELYSMNLEQWISDMKEGGRIAADDIHVFDELCDYLKSASGKKSFCFKSSILSDKNCFETCLVRTNTRSYNGNLCVIGMWNVVNTDFRIVADYTDENLLDPLTQLLNKKAITDYTKDMVEDMNANAVSLCILDIDDFKHVNDTYGHMFGDEVIKAVARLIEETIGDKGVAGRIGGDEFLFIIKVSSENELRSFLRSIKTRIKLLFEEKVGYSGLTCSIGAARSRIDSDNYADLFSLADKCLYIAKQKGKSRYIIYSEQLHGFLSHDATDMSAIREAFYPHQTMHEINTMLMELLLGKSEILSEFLETAKKTLLVDRLHIFWLPGGFVTAAGEVYYNCSNYLSLLDDEGYANLFDNDMLTITNTNLVEYSNPAAYAFFKKHSVFCTIQHLLRDQSGKLCGLITADECQRVHTFPAIAIQLFDTICTMLNAYLLRES